MNELIKVNYESDQPTVSARDLYDGLEIKTLFKDWFPRMAEYGFENGRDFNMLKNERVQIEGTRKVKREFVDYDISVDMAKQICMIQRSDKGQKYRQYFIDLEKAWNTPEQIMARAIKMADNTIDQLKNTNRQLTTEVDIKNQMIGELKPKADYTDVILKSKSLVTISQIAKDYGISGQEMNQILHEMKIQFKQNGQWLLYSKYHNKGYTHSETIYFRHTDGRRDVHMITKWTQKGRLFLYEALKKVEILPVIEQE